MGKRKGPLAATKKKSGGDFKKRTAKVGKRAVKQANVTKVNVRSKQLYMPAQRLAAAATGTGSSATATVAPGQERTAKGQSLAELLHQTRHHNEGARVGAVQGLKELVTIHPGLGAREMAGLLDGGLELLLDSEEEVRRAALGMLRALLLPSSSSEGSRDHRAGLLPFAPLAATYLCAALSHLDQSIRRDGLAYLDLLVQSLGPHLLPHAGDILPSLAALLDRPPHPSKRQAARLLVQQKQQQRLQAHGGGEEGASAKEKDQQLKARMELWAARAAVLRCALGLARLLPQQQQQAAVVQQQAITQAPSTPVVEWRRTPRVLLLRPTQQQAQTEAAMVTVAAEEEGPEGQSMEGLAALLPRVRNYVLELSTAPATAAAPAAMAVDGEGPGDGAAASASAEAEGQQHGQHHGLRHQVEGGPALDALAGAIEFALVATQSLAAAASSDDDEEGEAAAAVAVAMGEAKGLIGALMALFPLQLADGATALRTSLDEDEEEGEEEAAAVSGVVTEDGLNLALAEVATLGATAIASSSSSSSTRAGNKGGGLLLDAGVVSWLVGLMDRRAKALGGGGTAEGERLGGRLLRLLRGLLPRLYARGEVAVAERLLGSLEACTEHWAPGSANKRTALRLLCDLLPRRPTTATRAWVERTARTQLPSWAAEGHSALVAPVVAVLLKAAAEGDGEQGYVWLPDVVTVLLEPTALGSLPREARLRVCDLLYHCPALPPALQDAVVAAVQQQVASEFVDYVVEILHHRRQLLSPSAYLTLLGRLLALPPHTPLPHAAALGTTVGRTLRQLQQRPGSVLPMLAPLLVRLLDGGKDESSAAASTRQAALVVLLVLGEGDDEAVVMLPDALIAPLVGVVLGDNVEKDDEKEDEFAAASRPLLLCLLRRHGGQLLPPLVEAATPSVLSNTNKDAAAAGARFQGWLREPGLNWAPAKAGLVEVRRRCMDAGQPRLQGLVHDLDLLPLGLGK